MTVDEIWSQLVNPLRILLTLTVDADSPPNSLMVRVNDNSPWLEIIHPGLAAAVNELLPAHQVLLTRQHLGLTEVECWLFKAGRLSPVPQLVAAVATSTSQRTIENQLLELGAAAEVFTVGYTQDNGP